MKTENTKKRRESLRGYGHKIHVENKFTCKYCGYRVDDVNSWRQLVIDHVKPKSIGGNNKPNNLITVCNNCNSMTSRMGPKSKNEKARLTRHMSKKKIIMKKKTYVKDKVKEYREFYKEYVKKHIKRTR